MAGRKPRSSPVLTAHLRELEALDAAIGRIRRIWDLPAVREWYASRLDLDAVDATLYRTLRAIGLVADSDPSVNGVADKMRVDASTASRFIERAVAAGYAQRSSSPLDRRRSSIVLTQAGRDRLYVIRDLRVEFLAALTDAWATDEIVALTDALTRLDDAVDELAADDGD